tara:strand:- start:4313 stop:5302 length:990 start_codon:yes stop_codon:yes gene_type:complete
MADAWNEGTWGQGFWGQQSSITVSVTGVSASTALGTESVVGDSLVTLDSLQVTSALGTAEAEQVSVFNLTGVSFETQLSGVTVNEGAGVVASSLSMSFATGDESATGSVDAGWGRGTWGSFAWNENIEFITNVSSVSMSTALGTTTQEVGTGVIVSVTGLSMTSTAGTLEVSEATALVNPTALTVGVALSGASGITGEGNVGVIAPSDQLDFAIGTPVIDIFTQVDAPSVAMTSALGSVSTTADALVTLGSLSSSFSLGTETVEVGTGVIVSVSTVALTFAEGTAQGIGEAVVNVTGIDLTTVLGDTFETPWANVVTGASNTWTEVNAA